MKLTKEKLLYLWSMREEIFKYDYNAEIIQRYERIKELFQQIEDLNIDIAEDGISVDNIPILLNNENQSGIQPARSYFACKKDKLTADEAYTGVENMRDALPKEFSDLIEKIGCMLGGFDFNSHHTMCAEYRIISNTITTANDNGNLTSVGQMRHPSSHFADNNYFYIVADCIQKIKNDEFNPDESKLVLRWPNEAYYKDEKVAEKSQREALKHRFPYKFFYMWTHRNTVIHLVGLMAYRNLVQQEDSNIKYNHDSNMDESFDDFIAEDGWKKYSEAIKNLIPEEERGENFWDEMSKLLSVVMCQDQEVKSMKDLLDTGNKAIILWGPPGTGKTYSAESLVCQELQIDRSKLETYKFDKEKIHDEGCWDIVQFHPNYTYEDFIGGICPRLDGETLSYTLKEGIFKKICDTANSPENKEKKFILIIDEINRADLSAVFGELMYALEYRNRAVVIPNFEKPFVIPDNVYLIGTMNSVDKSLVTFDLALRRRFGFCKVMPNVNVLPLMLVEYCIEKNNLKEYIDRCEKLNNKVLRKLKLGEDYQIGHAYFSKIKDFLHKKEKTLISSFDLEKLWMYYLQPLLEEYVGSRLDDDDIKEAMKQMKEDFTKSMPKPKDEIGA